MTPLRIAFAVAGLFAGSASVASAHDVWISTLRDGRSARAVVNYGHPGDRPPAFIDKIVDLSIATAAGQKSLRDGIASKTVSGSVVAVTSAFRSSEPALISARYDNGYWIKTAQGDYRNATKRLITNGSDSIWSVKFAKAITAPGAPWQAVLGHELEIVPLGDPGVMGRGKILEVRVLFRGQPLKGAMVERGDGTTKMAEADIPKFAADDNGIARIPVVRRGPMLLAVDHRSTPSAVPDQADTDLYNATLWFLVTR